jgi:hypothetical protein
MIRLNRVFWRTIGDDIVVRFPDYRTLLSTFAHLYQKADRNSSVLFSQFIRMSQTVGTFEGVDMTRTESKIAFGCAPQPTGLVPLDSPASYTIYARASPGSSSRKPITSPAPRRGISSPEREQEFHLLRHLKDQDAVAIGVAIERLPLRGSSSIKHSR